MLKRLFRPKSQEPLPDFSDVRVTLKPILGIRPGIYLTFLYALIFISLIFVVFFLPGIINNGTWITFQSSPLPASIWIDGQRAGVTPCEILVKRGQHTISFSRPGYRTITISKDVGSYIFALPFLPLKDKIEIKLEIDDFEKLITTAYEEFGSWARVEEFSRTYRCPPVLTEAVKSIYARPSEENFKLLERLILACMPQVHDAYQAVDLLEALVILETRGKALGLDTFLRVYQRITSFLNSNPAQAFWVYLILPSKRNLALAEEISLPVTREDLEQNSWFKSQTEKYLDKIKDFKTIIYPLNLKPVTIEGIAFVGIPKADYLMGKVTNPSEILTSSNLRIFPVPVKVLEFYLSKTEITNAQFNSFLSENPFWRPSNKSTLLEKGLVDENYLKDWTGDSLPPSLSNLPVTNISSFAAEAFCQWLSLKVKAYLPSFQARLPLESEWEWASCGGEQSRFKLPGSVFKTENITTPKPVGSSQANIFGLQDMAGNVWEWCSDWFSWGANILPKNQSLSSYFKRGALRSLRGGSWANEADKIEAYSRGAAKPQTCSDYFGFRVALVKE